VSLLLPVLSQAVVFTETDGVKGVQRLLERKVQEAIDRMVQGRKTEA